MHVHLDRDHCLEVVVMRGRSDRLKTAAGRMLATRGVLQGGAEYVAEESLGLGSTGLRSAVASRDHLHPHDHHPSSASAHQPKARRAPRRRGAR